MFRVWLALDMNLPLAEVGRQAARAEALGCDVVTLPDVACDALLGAQAAIAATRSVTVATSGLVCFARSPMVTAVASWNLAALSGGRFRLGLSPLVAPMLTRKYGVEWQPPAPRMRDYIGALQAIYASWQDDVPLRYEGRHYRLTRQNWWTRPAPLAQPGIPIHIGAIGPRMSSVAGECASGLLTHPTNSDPRYLREVMLPRIELGARRAGRSPAGFELVAAPFCAAGATATEVDAQREQYRELLAINLSTPNYWPTLALHGWQATGERLNALVRAGHWERLAAEISGEMLAALLPAAPWPRLGRVLRERYAGIAPGICLALPADPEHDAALGRVVRELQE